MAGRRRFATSAAAQPMGSIQRRIGVVLGLALVAVLGESLAAWTVGLDEPAFFVLQATFAVGFLGLLVVVPLPLAVLTVLPVLAAGAGHLLRVASADGGGVGLLGLASVVLHLLGTGAGLLVLLRLASRTGAGQATSGIRLVALGGAALLAQSLSCGALLLNQEHASADGGLGFALLCTSLAPLAAAALMALALGPRSPRAPAGRALLGLLAGGAIVALPLLARWPWLLRAHHHLPPPAPAAVDLPDVVLIVLDTTRADRLSAWGYGRPTTPHLKALAATATRYSDAVSPGIWTLPGHASIFTGLYPPEHAADHTHPLPSETVTLAEWFRAAGYRTASFAANQMFRESAHYGLDQGFEVTWCEVPARTQLLVPRAALWLVGKLAPHVSVELRGALREGLLPFFPLLRESQPPSREVVEPALRWFDAMGDDAPRFLFVNLMEAHGMQRFHRCGAPQFGSAGPFSPYQAEGSREIEAGLRDMSPEDLERLGAWYDTGVACMDLHLGELLQGLRERGAFDGALIAVVADHGEMIGDHRAFGHRGEVWQGLVHVPLVLKLPGQRTGSVCDHPTDTSALSAVLPVLAGLPPLERLPPWAGDPQWVPDFVAQRLLSAGEAGSSRPLRDAPCPLPQRRAHPLSIAGPSLTLSHDLSERWERSWIAVRDGSLKLVENDLGSRWVADLASPEGELPLPPDPAQAARLEGLLGAWRAEELQLEPGRAESDAAREAERQRVLRQLGYADGQSPSAPR